MFMIPTVSEQCGSVIHRLFVLQVNPPDMLDGLHVLLYAADVHAERVLSLMHFYTTVRDKSDTKCA